MIHQKIRLRTIELELSILLFALGGFPSSSVLCNWFNDWFIMTLTSLEVLFKINKSLTPTRETPLAYSSASTMSGSI